MHSGRRRVLVTSAIAAFLMVAELTGAAFSRDLHASRSEAASNETVTNAPSPWAAAPATLGRTPSEFLAVPAISAPREAPPPELIRHATFSAAGLLAKDSGSIRLIGVVATALDAQCGSGQGLWPCGRVARAALQRFVRGRAIECRRPESDQVADDLAQCSVGGKDIGKWLVSQGWARAEGSNYADVEQTARDEKRGIWSPFRPGLAPEPVFEVGPIPTNAAVIAQVDLSTQSMTLVHRGQIVGQWPVSTARVGKETPTGMWTAKWLARNHRSSLYNDAPMPYSVFYDGDYAVHGTYQTDRLGRPASAGCVRLRTEHAAVLFDLVGKEGLNNTLIVIRH